MQEGKKAEQAPSTGHELPSPDFLDNLLMFGVGVVVLPFPFSSP